LVSSGVTASSEGALQTSPRRATSARSCEEEAADDAGELLIQQGRERKREFAKRKKIRKKKENRWYVVNIQDLLLREGCFSNSNR